MALDEPADKAIDYCSAPSEHFPLNILLVKLSSLGDVLHNLPIVWDVRARFPDAHLDWVVEEGYGPLLEPMRSLDGARGIDEIIPLGFRRWRRSLSSGDWSATWSQFGEFRHRLRQRPYDLIIETQGLIKSAIVTRLTRRPAQAIVAGLANRTEFSGYEPLARLGYSLKVHVPVHCHAVDRSRMVTAAALGTPSPHRTEAPPRFYPKTFVQSLAGGAWLDRPYALCFHATARAAKRWPDERWVSLGHQLAQAGLAPVFPWGSATEKGISEDLARQVPGAVVPAAFSLEQAFGVVAGARLVVGVDTGLTHLAAILGRPTIELYCDSPRWKTEGYWSPVIRNLGDLGNPPSLHSVTAAAAELL